jgi:O-antigen/teichoic acid export membrane protein
VTNILFLTTRRYCSAPAKAGIVNGVFGIVDYLVQPIAMLIAAPLLIRYLGISQYGVLMLAIATVGAGNMFAASFGDAAVKYVSACRGRGDVDAVKPIVRCVLMINVCLGTALALLLYVFAPAVVEVMKINGGLRVAGIRALQIGAAVLLVRSVECVFIGVLRAFEHYRAAAQITSSMRILAIAASVLLAYVHRDVSTIMAAILCTVAVGAALLAVSIHSKVGPVLTWPSWNTKELSEVMSFGAASWLLGLSGMAFNQVDRLLVGVFLGPIEVGYYSVCTQATQPIHGIVASGLHFLFPHLSAKMANAEPVAVQRSIKRALGWNLVLALLLSTPLTLYSRNFLTFWMGKGFAAHAWLALGLLSVASGLVALNVALHYSLLAMGCIRNVAVLNLIAGGAMLTVMALLIPRFGIVGAALGRLVYGPVTWLMYLKLNDALRPPHIVSKPASATAATAEI